MNMKTPDRQSLEQVSSDITASDQGTSGKATSYKAAPDKPISVLIADDQKLVRDGFRLLLSSYPDIDVVGEAADGSQAYELSRIYKPQVVLMDIRMSNVDGIAATKKITSDDACAQTHVLVLTTFDIDEYVYDALLAGASGFMLKDAEPDDIVHAIHVIARGDALIQPSITRRLIAHFVHRQTSSISNLTDREQQILILVARGFDNTEIADQLVISPATVKTHIARIMAKLHAHDRAQLVIQAYECGLIVPGRA